VSLVRGLAKPRHRLGIILRQILSVGIHQPKAELRGYVSSDCTGMPREYQRPRRGDFTGPC
jgi:hypothetical protein